MLKSKFNNQLSYVKSLNDSKDFHNFKIIKIVYNEFTQCGQVLEIFEFTHPKYQEQQFLYLNHEADLMIEWLSHNRVLLYEKQEIGKQ